MTLAFLVTTTWALVKCFQLSNLALDPIGSLLGESNANHSQYIVVSSLDVHMHFFYIYKKFSFPNQGSTLVCRKIHTLKQENTTRVHQKRYQIEEYAKRNHTQPCRKCSHSPIPPLGYPQWDSKSLKSIHKSSSMSLHHLSRLTLVTVGQSRVRHERGWLEPGLETPMAQVRWDRDWLEFS